jgi:hypothetical protein
VKAGRCAAVAGGAALKAEARSRFAKTDLAADAVRQVHRTFTKALKDLGVVIDGIRQPR